MVDESNLGAVGAGRLARWGALGLAVAAAVVLYFVMGRHVVPIAVPPDRAAPLTR